ncbi:MAG: translocase [Pseudomonadaceae bacterium]|nr:translocase [Pseudomonadaceae bacterium]HCP53926.1 translocase [Pseudomonas sp.]
MRVFSRYLAIGVLNTAVHWSVFFCVFYLLGGSQLVSNISAFCLAVTFSFLMNARFTFRQSATSKRYIIYIIFMGAVSILFGSISDHFNATPILTLMLFSVFSLGFGFLYSRYIVFR